MRTKRLDKGAFTLVEIMIVSTVSLILIGLLSQVFITATRRTEDSRLKVDLQQQAVLIRQRFDRDMQNTTLRTMIGDQAAHYLICLTRFSGWDNQGELVWETEQKGWLYLPSEKTLRQEIIRSVDLSEDLHSYRPYIPSPTDLTKIATILAGSERVLSTYVEEFSLSDGTGDTENFTVQPLKLEMKLRRPLSTSERYAEFTLEKRYALRNF